jgi:hypothetical protein
MLHRIGIYYYSTEVPVNEICIVHTRMFSIWFTKCNDC